MGTGATGAELIFDNRKTKRAGRRGVRSAHGIVRWLLCSAAAVAMGEQAEQDEAGEREDLTAYWLPSSAANKASSQIRSKG